MERAVKFWKLLITGSSSYSKYTCSVQRERLHLGQIIPAQRDLTPSSLGGVGVVGCTLRVTLSFQVVEVALIKIIINYGSVRMLWQKL